MLIPRWVTPSNKAIDDTFLAESSITNCIQKILSSLKRVRLLEPKDWRDPDVDSSGSRTPNSLIQYQPVPVSEFPPLSKPEAPVRPSSTNTNIGINANVSTGFRREKYSEAHVGSDNDTIE